MLVILPHKLHLRIKLWIWIFTFITLPMNLVHMYCNFETTNVIFDLLQTGTILWRASFNMDVSEIWNMPESRSEKERERTAQFFTSEWFINFLPSLAAAGHSWPHFTQFQGHFHYFPRLNLFRLKSTLLWNQHLHLPGLGVKTKWGACPSCCYQVGGNNNSLTI